MKKDQSGFGVLVILAVLLVAGVIGFAAWRVMDKPKQTQRTNAHTNYATSNETKGQTYTNKQYHISFTYPDGWLMKPITVSYLLQSVSFTSPDYTKTNLDNGYLLTGGEFHLEVQSLDADKENAEQYLHKSSVDTTADYIQLLQAGAEGQASYSSPDTIDGVAAGRGSFGDYVHGPQVFWVKDHLLYMVYYDGPLKGADAGKYTTEFNDLLKSIDLK
jgi:hypothetical protein